MYFIAARSWWDLWFHRRTYALSRRNSRFTSFWSCGFTSNCTLRGKAPLPMAYPPRNTISAHWPVGNSKFKYSDLSNINDWLADATEEFLSTETGKPYAIAFRGLRLPSLLGHPQDVDMLLGDRLIPAKLLDPVFRTQWYNMLRADQGIDKGCVTFICYRGPHYSKD